MDFWATINITLNFLSLINLIITIFVCLFILVLILIFHRQSRSVPLLLSCHTCLILLVSSFLLSSMVISSLFGFFSINLEQHGNTTWCLWRGFLIHAILCVLYDSYILQAIYRLFRVVFPRYKYLHNYSLYCFLILFETCFGIISIAPGFIRGYVIYLPTEYYCQTPFTNILGITYIAVRLFLLPLIFISITYLWILNYIHRRNIFLNIYCRRSKQYRRNLIIIRRILLMLTFLILLGLPSMIFLILYIVTGHLVSITYRAGWLSVSFSFVFLTYMLIKLTKPLKKTVKKVFSRFNFVIHRSNNNNNNNER